MIELKSVFSDNAFAVDSGEAGRQPPLTTDISPAFNNLFRIVAKRFTLTIYYFAGI